MGAPQDDTIGLPGTGIVGLCILVGGRTWQFLGSWV